MEQVTNHKHHRKINLEVLASKRFMAWIGLDKYIAADREWFLHDQRVQELLQAPVNLNVVDLSNYWHYDEKTRTLLVDLGPEPDHPEVAGFKMTMNYVDKLVPADDSPWQDDQFVEGEKFLRNSSWFVNKITGQLISIADHGEVGYTV